MPSLPPASIAPVTTISAAANKFPVGVASRQQSMQRPHAGQTHEQAENKTDQQRDLLGFRPVNEFVLAGRDQRLTHRLDFIGCRLFVRRGDGVVTGQGRGIFDRSFDNPDRVFLRFIQLVGLLIAKHHHHDLHGALDEKRHREQPADQPGKTLRSQRLEIHRQGRRFDQTG